MFKNSQNLKPLTFSTLLDGAEHATATHFNSGELLQRPLPFPSLYTLKTFSVNSAWFSEASPKTLSNF
jgi:hypothetical protein